MGAYIIAFSELVASSDIYLPHKFRYWVVLSLTQRCQLISMELGRSNVSLTTGHNDDQGSLEAARDGRVYRLPLSDLLPSVMV